MIENIAWLGHGGFRIKSQNIPTIYIDPWRTAAGGEKADIILLSHEHLEHCSPGEVNKLRGPDTVVIGSPGVQDVIGDFVITLKPWQSMSHGRVLIRAVPAYEPEGTIHPRSAEGLGFVISANLYDVYYAGDTALIPEMENIGADVAIVPIGGRGVMTPEEAAKAVERTRARWTIPSHWGEDGSGSLVDLETFVSACRFAEVHTLTHPRLALGSRVAAQADQAAREVVSPFNRLPLRSSMMGAD